jgi:ABC-type branched-subunit amino acid transport system ATPase component/ABC-type branched-subunit amino acid transport system permease subunit
MAQSAFVLAGAFSAAIMLDAGAPFLVAALVGTAVAAAVGFIIALPTRRLGGLPLALATLALAYIGEKLVYQIRGISGGSSGWELRPPVLGPIDGSNPRILVVIMLVVVGLVVAIIHNLRNSSTGRAMLALRSTETGAITAGIAVGKMKLLIFVISAAIAGFGGIMLASTNGRVTNLDYPVMLGLVWLATTVTLGVRRPAGALLAGLSSALLPEIFNWVPDSNYLLSVLFGLGAVNLAKNPDGVLAMVAELRAGRRGARQAAGPTAGSPAAPVATTVSRPVVVKPAAAADPDQVPVLSLRGIRAGYGEVEVLHGVDLTVAPGEVVALLGSNGAGKTTLSCLVGGLMRPTAGTIELNGVDVTSSTAHVRSRQGVFLAPEGRGVFPDLTVEENLSLWLRDEDERTAAYDAFPILGTRRRQLAGALSGGEQQMLTLAPAIVAPPKLLIADEPSLGLAPLIVDQIFESLRELNRQGVALLVAEEKTRDALGLADRAAFLSVGHFTWIGPAADVDSDLLAGVYLGVGQNEHHGPATGPEAGGGTTEAATAGDAVPAAAEPATGLATPAEPAAAGSTAAAVSAASGASADA